MFSKDGMFIIGFEILLPSSTISSLGAATHAGSSLLLRYKRLGASSGAGVGDIGLS